LRPETNNGVTFNWRQTRTGMFTFYVHTNLTCLTTVLH